VAAAAGLPDASKNLVSKRATSFNRFLLFSPNFPRAIMYVRTLCVFSSGMGRVREN